MSRIFFPVMLLVVAFLLLAATEASWVDPDTPEAELTMKPLTEGDNRQFELVFSDEFEQDGRTFNDGNDPRWTAIHKNDYTNSALHFYSHKNANTSRGVLNISTEQKINTYKAFDEKKKTFYADKKYIQTGMLQSWNKFCFVGGIVEFSAKLPGEAKTGGLWPALWMLGNLARATYVGSSDFMWPFSYSKCNQATRTSQEINACSKVNHFGLDPYRGRGAPEIDLIESMQGEAGKLPNTFVQRPYQSASLQVAPGIEIDRPVMGKRPHPGNWYSHLEYGNETISDLNPFFYGVTLVHEPKAYTYQSDAISANMQLDTTHFERQHLYRVEWEPPAEDGSGGYIKWFTDGKLIHALYGKSLSIMQTEIPSEPMYLIMNTAVSSHWGFPAPCPDNCDCKCFECGDPACACALPSGYCDNYPASFEIDYVRVYQAVNEPRHILGCSPEERPTALFIKGHAKRYMSEGEKVPLQSIRTGGGVCSKARDCGGAKRGTCSSGSCSCQEGWNGPNCLSHAGFFDVDTSAPVPRFYLSRMMIPKGLCVILGLLITGFLLSLTISISVKGKEPKYQKIAGAGANDSSFHPGASGSYQNSDQANTQYAISPSQNVVTYCVIDGRLVDS